MEISEKADFLKLLKATFSAYAKPIPEGDLLAAWWAELSSYSASVVLAAFRAYRDGGSEFVPTPAAIAKRCVLCDGRPSADEAWSIALASRDESATVVWTDEISQAFATCSKVFPDEVGARMAFKDTYSRLVTGVRGCGMPARWSVSLGWDMRKRDAVLAQAVTAKLLPAPLVAGLLYAPIGESPPDSNAKIQIMKIKTMLAQAREEKLRNADLHAKREHEAIAERKRVLAAQVAPIDNLID